jgi:hypothetical protein
VTLRRTVLATHQADLQVRHLRTVLVIRHLAALVHLQVRDLPTALAAVLLTAHQ